MSAALAFPLVLDAAQAVASTDLPAARARIVKGYAFYRRHSAALLRRYFRVSMELGRTPCLLGKMVFRGRVSSYRLKTFEDLLIFVLDVEKCLKQLDGSSQTVIAHTVLEDYTAVETASIMKESERSVERIYAQALDRLTRQFLHLGLLDPKQICLLEPRSSRRPYARSRFSMPDFDLIRREASRAEFTPPGPGFARCSPNVEKLSRGEAEI